MLPVALACLPRLQRRGCDAGGRGAVGSGRAALPPLGLHVPSLAALACEGGASSLLLAGDRFDGGPFASRLQALFPRGAALGAPAPLLHFEASL